MTSKISARKRIWPWLAYLAMCLALRAHAGDACDPNGVIRTPGIGQH